MTLFENTVQAFKHKDFDLLQRIHREDFMFVRKFSISSKEEHLANRKRRLPTTSLHKRHQCVYANDNMLAMRYPGIDENGVSDFTSNVSMKQEGLYWRTMV